MHPFAPSSFSQIPTHHSPPEGVRVALKVRLESVGAHGVLLGEIHEVAGEDEAEEADVQRRDQLLKERLPSKSHTRVPVM